MGLQNYRFMFNKGPDVLAGDADTLWIIAVGVPLHRVTSLSLAWLLTRPKRGSRYYRTALFLPTMIPPVAAALGFVFLFNPATGPINQGLESPRDEQPAPLVLQRVLVEVGARLPQPLGLRPDDDGLPRRAPRRA